MKLIRGAASSAVFALTLVAQAAMAASAVYHVASDGSGNNGNSGLSPALAVATLQRANELAVASDKVLLKTGNVWQETLKLKSGVSYASYSTGATSLAKPVVRGSVAVGALSWVLDDGHIWVADVSNLVGNETDMYGNVVDGGISQLFLNGQRLTRARYPNVGGGLYAKGANRFLPAGQGTPVVGSSVNQRIDVNATVKLDNGTTTTVGALLAGKDLLNADVFVKNNDWVMTRYRSTAGTFGADNMLALLADDKNSNGDNYGVDRHAPRDLQWPGVTNYELSPGYGYWLEGKRWMLDAPGEWSYDPQTKRLYVWLPNGASPQGAALTAATRLHAISGFNVQSVNVDNIEARETRSDAIKIDGYDVRVSSLTLSNISALQAGRKGINVINTARPGATIQPVGIISNALVEDSINEGIDLSGDRRWAVSRAQQVSVTGSTVRRAGRGYYARGAVLLGHRGQADGNVVESSSYIGIHGGKLNQISNNVVKDGCLAFDDCGAIYTGGNYYAIREEEPSTTWGDNDVVSTISGNFVNGALVSDDRLDGSGASNGYNGGARKSNVGGIYLDDYSGRVTVTGNHVTGSDMGVLLHQGSYNTVSGNDVVGNRMALFLQENQNPTFPMQGNVITNNVLATSSSEPLVFQQNTHGSTANLASYTGNYYASLRTTSFVHDDALNATIRLKTFKQWQASGKDTGASNSRLHATSFGLQAASGAVSLTPSGTFNGSSANGWYGSLATVAPVLFNNYLLITASGTPDTVGAFRRFTATPPESFAVQKGDKYWLTFNAQADSATELVLGLRRGGWPYDDLSVPVVVPVTSTAQSYSRLITAEAAVSDAVLPFRFYVDKSKTATQSRVRISAVSMIKASVVTGNAGPVGFYNAGTTEQSYDCPNSVPALCASYKDARDQTVVTFPIKLAPKASKVIVLNSPGWLDTDRDGIPGDSSNQAGGRDACGASADGISMRETGCGY